MTQSVRHNYISSVGNPVSAVERDRGAGNRKWCRGASTTASYILLFWIDSFIRANDNQCTVSMMCDRQYLSHTRR